MTGLDHHTPEELAALLHFYAEAGVEWLVEDEPVNRFADATSPEARTNSSPAVPSRDPVQSTRVLTGASSAPAGRPLAEPAIPNADMVQQARLAAQSARDLAELKAIIEAFDGCNLKRSAKTTITATGNPNGGVFVIGSIPTADEDRDGAAFTGPAGRLFDAMMGAIGLKRDSLLVTTALPWRPPGGGAPSPAASDICLPFLERQIELAEPSLVLLLGNFALRALAGPTSAIDLQRGQWMDLAYGHRVIATLASYHPSDLLAAPANKKLAWQDLQQFRARLNSLGIA